MRTKTDIAPAVEFAMGRLSHEESIRFLDDVERNPELSASLDMICHLLREPGVFAEQPEGTPAVRASTRRTRSGRVTEQSLVYAVRLAASVLVVLGGLWLWSVLAAPAWIAWARVDSTDLDIGIRGAGSGELAAAEALLQREEYQAALDLLRWVAKVATDRNSVVRAKVLQGWVHLLLADQRWAGLHVRTDKVQVNRGLAVLHDALGTDGDGDLRATALWLTAKGYLLQENVAGACEVLRGDEVLQSRYGDRARMLSRLLQCPSGAH